MDNKIIQKLTDLANPEAMTSKDFIANYKVIINHVVDIKKMLAKKANILSNDFNAKKKEIETKSSNILLRLNNEFENEVKKIDNIKLELANKIDTRLSQIKVKDGVDGKDGKDGKDGANADSDKILNEVLAKIDFTETKDELETLKKMMEELDDKISAVRRTRGGGTGGNNQAVQYADLTAQCNGVLKTFTIPTCRKVVALSGTQFPVIYRPIVDYTIGNKTITLTDEVSAPETGQTLTLLYIK